MPVPGGGASLPGTEEALKNIASTGVLGSLLVIAFAVIVGLFMMLMRQRSAQDAERKDWQAKNDQAHKDFSAALSVVQEKRLTEARESLTALNNVTASLNMLSQTVNDRSMTSTETTSKIMEFVRSTESAKEYFKGVAERLETNVSRIQDRLTRGSSTGCAP